MVVIVPFGKQEANILECISSIFSLYFALYLNISFIFFSLDKLISLVNMGVATISRDFKGVVSKKFPGATPPPPPLEPTQINSCVRHCREGLVRNAFFLKLVAVENTFRKYQHWITERVKNKFDALGLHALRLYVDTLILFR